MVRRKNVLAALMHSFIPLGVITVQWVLFGYSLAFDNDIGHFIGDLSKALFMEIDFKTLSGHPGVSVQHVSVDVRHHHCCPYQRRNGRTSGL